MAVRFDCTTLINISKNRFLIENRFARKVKTTWSSQVDGMSLWLYAFLASLYNYGESDFNIWALPHLKLPSESLDVQGIKPKKSFGKVFKNAKSIKLANQITTSKGIKKKYNFYFRNKSALSSKQSEWVIDPSK